MPDFPQMRHKKIQLFRRKIKIIFPNVAIFDVIIGVDNVIIRLYRKTAVITAGQSPHRKQYAVFPSFGKSAVIRPVRQKLRPLARRINTQQRMTEQRRRIAHISVGKQQRHPRRPQVVIKFFKFCTFGKGLIRHSCFFQKFIA